MAGYAVTKYIYGDVILVPMANNITIAAGDTVVWNGSGYATNGADTMTPETFIGVAINGKVTPTDGTGGAAGAPEISVRVWHQADEYEVLADTAATFAQSAIGLIYKADKTAFDYTNEATANTVGFRAEKLVTTGTSSIKAKVRGRFMAALA